MPVVSGLETSYSYRCDGSNNTGGVQPAELIAMCAVAISQISKGETPSDTESAALAKLSAITEDYLGVVPDTSNHSMTLLQKTGEKGYVLEKNNGEFVYREQKDGDDLKDVQKFGYAEKGSLGIQIYPILERDIKNVYNMLVADWKLNNPNEEMSSSVVAELQEEAERQVPAVGFKFITLDETYIEHVSPMLKIAKTVEVIDEKYWTPERLDNFGCLSKTNTVWLS